MRKSILAAVLAAAAAACPSVVIAQAGNEEVRQTFSHEIPDIPGKSLIAVEVTYPPGGASLPHRHASSAFIYARVLSGRIESQVDRGAARVYRAGESFFEEPGAHHRISRNASKTEPAKLLAVFVVNTDEAPLTTPDLQKSSR